MTTVNALKLRNQLGEVLEELDREKEPILVSKQKKIRAVLIPYEEFQKRFIGKQAEEERRKLLESIRSHRVDPPEGFDVVQVLRRCRGYKD